jgi:hypothetical protein
MTQQPRNGPHAPRTAEFAAAFGSATASPSHADAPTATVPTIGGGRGPSPATPPVAPVGPAGTNGSAPAGSAVGYVPSGQREAPSTQPPRVSRSARQRGPRRARLQLRHINPWTVLKFSAVLSIALFFVWLIVVGVLYGVLDGAGIIGRINDAVTTINGPGSKAPVTATVVFGGAAIIGVVNIILFIALSTIGSVVYNLCADLVGGIEITLSER